MNHSDSPFSEFRQQPKFGFQHPLRPADLILRTIVQGGIDSFPYDIGYSTNSIQAAAIMQNIPQVIRKLAEVHTQVCSEDLYVSPAVDIAYSIGMQAFIGITAEAVRRSQAYTAESGRKITPAEYARILQVVLSESGILDDDDQHSHLIEAMDVGISVIHQLGSRRQDYFYHDADSES